MKLTEKLKNIPRKKLAVAGILAAMLAATAAVTVVVANRRDETPSSGGTVNTDSVSVFKSGTSSDTAAKKSDTVEPIDLNGVNGLKYVSNGDGTCSISGIGSCKETELKIPAYSPSGDAVTKLADGAFANCTELLTVTVPATVKSIGTGVFRGCSSLVAINTDTENTVYCSVGGVLFSKDKTVLVCFPMNRPGANYLLSTNVKAVAAYAFEGAVNLKGILYEGGISDYRKIDFLMGNGILDEISITLNYVSAK